MIRVETWEEGFEGLGEGDRASRMWRVKSETPPQGWSHLQTLWPWVLFHPESKVYPLSFSTNKVEGCELSLARGAYTWERNPLKPCGFVVGIQANFTSSSILYLHLFLYVTLFFKVPCFSDSNM